MKSYLINIILILAFLSHAAVAQETGNMVRIARLTIDAEQLNEYKAFLREEIETSLKVESGVLMLYAVSEQDQPSHITIVEIYQDEKAYQEHIRSPHFIKYKTGTQDMVQSLELIEVDPVVPGFVPKK